MNIEYNSLETFSITNTRKLFGNNSQFFFLWPKVLLAFSSPCFLSSLRKMPIPISLHFIWGNIYSNLVGFIPVNRIHSSIFKRSFDLSKSTLSEWLFYSFIEEYFRFCSYEIHYTVWNYFAMWCERRGDQLSFLIIILS